MKKAVESITVTQVDAALEKKIIKLIEDAEREETKKVVNLKLNSTTGSTEIALSILNRVHSSKYIDMHVEATGAIGVAGTLLIAGAEPRFRIAEFGTTFRILETETNNDGTDSKSMNTLKHLTGKKKLLVETINTSSIVNAETAKKLNLVDNRSKFISKYKVKKAEQNTNEENQSE